MFEKFGRLLRWFLIVMVPAVALTCNLFSPTPAPAPVALPGATIPPAAVIPPTPTLRQVRTPVPTADLRLLNPENGHLYLLVRNVTSWSRAARYCSQQGSHLVTIDSEAENTFVYGLGGWSTWLGASDAEQEGTWAWVTGEPMTYTNWQAGDPDNCCPPEACGGTDCIDEDYLTFTGGMDWKDEAGIWEYQFVCEWDNP